MATRQPRPMAQGTLREAADKAAADWRKLGTKWGLIDVHSYLEPTIAWFEARGHKDIASITQEDLMAWVANMEQRGNSPRTLLHKKNVLRRVYEMAGIDAKPVDRTVVAPRPKTWVLSVKELMGVTMHLTQEGYTSLALLVLWSALTGMSMEECKALRVKHLDLEHGAIIRGPLEEEAILHPLALKVLALALEADGGGGERLVFVADYSRLDYIWDVYAKPFLGIAHARYGGLATVRRMADAMRSASKMGPRYAARRFKSMKTSILYIHIEPYKTKLDADVRWQAAFREIEEKVLPLLRKSIT